MGYFLYVRKSEEDDGRQVQSIGDQVKIGQQLADDMGVRIIEILQEARSAKRPGRPVFTSMIDRIEAGEADGIIAWHPDRLSRNAVDAGRIIDLLDQGKLHDLKFQSYKFENTPEGKWMLNIVLGQSKYYVDKLSKDVKRGIQSKLEKGHYPQVAPPGYLNNAVNHTIEADPERFDMMQRALKMVLTGVYSAPQVLDILNNQWGFRTIRRARSGGGPLPRSAFYRLLTNIFYTGLMEHGGQIFQGKHPAMITQREFEEIQRLLGRGKVHHHQRKEFDFTGLIKCGLCGCRITAETKTKHYKGTGRTRTYTYYHCTNGKGGCSKQSVTQELIEAQIADLLDRATLHLDFVKWSLKPAQSYYQEESGFSHDKIETLQKALSTAERRKSNLISTQLDNPGVFSPAEFSEQKEKLQAEINQIKKDTKKVEGELEAVRGTVENVFDFAVNAKYNFDHGDTKLRKEISSRLGISYSLTLGKLDIVPHPLLVPILTLQPQKIGSENNKDGSCGAVRPCWLTIRDEVRTLAMRLETSFAKTQWQHETGA